MLLAAALVMRLEATHGMMLKGILGTLLETILLVDTILVVTILAETIFVEKIIKTVSNIIGWPDPW